MKRDSMVEQAEGIHKRQFLKGLAALLGATATNQILTPLALAQADSFYENNEHQSLSLLNHSQRAILRQLCELIIPKTDTPSAAELNVHEFIEHQLTYCYSKSQQQGVSGLLNFIDQQAVDAFNLQFVAATANQQTRLVIAIENRDLGFSQLQAQQFSFLKYLTVFGYFTTEIGASQVLAYQAVPGGYKGSIPYENVGKGYGSLAYY